MRKDGCPPGQTFVSGRCIEKDVSSRRIDDIVFKSDDLRTLARTLLADGYDVITHIPSSPGKPGWIHYGKDGEIGYAQTGEFGGIEYSTVHKPCRECGTGYQVESNGSPTLENAEKALVNRPDWASWGDPVRKYRDLGEYLEKEKVLDYTVLRE